MSAISVGIVGTGFGADVILPALKSHTAFNLAGISSRKYSSLDTCKASYSPDFPLVDLDYLFYSQDIDALIIAVPPSSQYAFVKKALNCGKHVLCEKPLSFSLDQARDLDRIATSMNLVLAVDYEFRYDPLLEACVSVIASNDIGKLHSITVRWWTSGALNRKRTWSWRDDSSCCSGVLSEWCSHVIDYLQHICKGNFTEISCRLDTEVKARRSSPYFSLPVKTPDTCILAGKISNKISVKVEISTARRSSLGHYISLYGENGDFVSSILPPFESVQAKLLTTTSSKLFQTEDITNFSYPCDARIFSVQRLLTDFSLRISGMDTEKLPLSDSALSVWRVLSAATSSAQSSSNLLI